MSEERDADPRGMPGPTADERAQVWSARHLVGGLMTLAIGAVALVWWFFHSGKP